MTAFASSRYVLLYLALLFFAPFSIALLFPALLCSALLCPALPCYTLHGSSLMATVLFCLAIVGCTLLYPACHHSTLFCPVIVCFFAPPLAALFRSALRCSFLSCSYIVNGFNLYYLLFCSAFFSLLYSVLLRSTQFWISFALFYLALTLSALSYYLLLYCSCSTLLLPYFALFYPALLCSDLFSLICFASLVSIIATLLCSILLCFNLFFLTLICPSLLLPDLPDPAMFCTVILCHSLLRFILLWSISLRSSLILLSVTLTLLACFALFWSVCSVLYPDLFCFTCLYLCCYMLLCSAPDSILICLNLFNFVLSWPSLLYPALNLAILRTVSPFNSLLHCSLVCATWFYFALSCSAQFFCASLCYILRCSV